MAALVQTLELATPKASFATVVQGADESFLRFAGRLTTSVEKQVADPEARRLVLTHLARCNCNDDCRRIIEALPGDPSISQMAEACAKMGTSGHKMVALATAVQPVWAVLKGRK